MARAAADTEARKRAREAMAAKLAARKRQDELIEKATLSYYLADEAANAARVELGRADEARALALVELSELGQSVTDIAALCGIPSTEVRTLRKGRSIINQPPLDEVGDTSQ